MLDSVKLVWLDGGMAHITSISRIARNHDDLVAQFLNDAKDAENMIVLQVPGHWQYDVILPVGMAYTFHGKGTIELRRLTGLVGTVELDDDQVRLTGIQGGFLRVVGDDIKIDMSSGSRK